MSWLIDNLAHLIEVALIWVVNELITSAGTLISASVSILPDMPSVPTFTLPGGVQTWYDFGAYWFPVSFIITTTAAVFVIWFAWLVVAIPLRWGKAVPGSE